MAVLEAQGLTKLNSQTTGTTDEIKIDPRAAVIVTGNEDVTGTATLQFSLVSPNVAVASDWFDADAGAQTDDFNDSSLKEGIRGVRFVVAGGTWTFRVSQVIDTRKNSVGF